MQSLSYLKYCVHVAVNISHNIRSLKILKQKAKKHIVVTIMLIITRLLSRDIKEQPKAESQSKNKYQ